MDEGKIIVNHIERLAEISRFKDKEILHLKRFVMASLLPITSSVLNGLGYEVPVEIAKFSLVSNGMQMLIAADYLKDLFQHERSLAEDLKNPSKNVLGLRRW